MTTKDIPQVYALLKTHLETFKVTPKLKQEDVAQRLIPKDGVIYTYVVENADTK